MALLSVAMLFVAPVISKSLAHHSDCVNPAIMTAMPDHHGMTMSGMHHDMAMPEHCEQNLPVVHRMMPGHAMSPMEEIACGYCQLLIHLPFVQFVLTVMLWLILLCVRLPLPLPAILSPIFRAWTPQRARAPPAFFLSAK
ncbi:TPA: DUF2946 domain-containing protein [Salmonella enterica subsp. enterica serovar Saintpaul]|jgi:hypothetical protein|uniref:DUF2946 domain-containing protein n=2 Tax=Enterobacterales TaxID=91347 RepID=UPI0009B2530F|nr:MULTISPECIES: DUF2946 domain-containing protein [Enterobacteriaceae]EAO6748136.1 DUF2946 domain-containing protein [Salmonella enterica]EBS5434252.1 DUF2946 domain-containing protein [Salmonella enterica subsp. enterica serovar Binza]EDQ2670557.1 DUF2946 domain-containing protein [Salmonella enterica subsp. enterica serovar Saintpaul]EIV5419364.1 DUF2946 domain-containing protein [Klebsiella aerogenes]HAN1837146.1 DUF2946 domain-containing protein [Escherichia coli]HAV1803880.1 DUF2946 dom